MRASYARSGNAHHDQRLIPVGELHAFAQAPFLDKALAGIERLGAHTLCLDVEPEPVRVQVTKCHRLQESHTGAAQAPPLGLQHDACIPLVEDNEVSREVALAMLRGFGLAADTAVEGREALVKALGLRSGADGYADAGDELWRLCFKTGR